MERKNILEALYEACETILAVDRSELTEETTFGGDLEADSLSLVEIVMSLEETFDIRIPEEDLGGVETIGAAADLVAGHLAASR